MERIYQMHVVPDLIPELHPTIDLRIQFPWTNGHRTLSQRRREKSGWYTIEPGRFLTSKQVCLPCIPLLFWCNLPDHRFLNPPLFLLSFSSPTHLSPNSPARTYQSDNYFPIAVFSILGNLRFFQFHTNLVASMVF